MALSERRVTALVGLLGDLRRPAAHQPLRCGGEGAMRGLGELQAAVMNVLWDATEPLKVRQVLDRLDTGKPLAYTTVMTVLDSLHRKCWACRDMDGNAYRYRPAVSRPEAAARALRDILDTSGDPDAVLLHFASSISDHESALLREALRSKSLG